MILRNPPTPLQFATADEYNQATVAYYRATTREVRADMQRRKRERDVRMLVNLARAAFDFATRLPPWIQLLLR